jgi:molecular chaperone DnaK
MGYRLGVDLGTSFTAATIGRAGSTAGASLGVDSAIVPSVVYIGVDGERLYGAAAAARPGADGRVLRGFVRRIGDETPMVPEAGAATAAHRVTADFVAWVVAQATVQEGRAPDAVVVTHPATWGPHKRDLLGAALREAGVPGPSLVSGAVAAATIAGDTYSPGSVLAVYDLGGRTFDAALLRREEAGTWTSIGRPAGLIDLGGADLDDLVLAHVLAGLTPDQQQAMAQLDAEDEATAAALAGLRSACVRAKEALSADTVASVEVKLPGITAKVRLTRSEFEAMICASIGGTLDVLDSVLDSAGVTAADLDGVLIAGGASRIPLVTQMLSSHFQQPVVATGGKSPATALAAGAVLSLGEFPAVAAPAVQAVKQAVKTAKPKPGRKMAKAQKGDSVAQAAPLAKAPAPVMTVPAPAKPVNPMPGPGGPGSKPIRPRRSARRAEIVGLEGLSSVAPATGVVEVPTQEGPRAVVPARAVRSLDALLTEEPVRLARAEEHLPPPRPALDDAGFATVDGADLGVIDAGWTWRSLASVRRGLALTVLTGAIFVGSTAWNPATPTITDKPVTDVKTVAATVTPAKHAAD